MRALLIILCLWIPFTSIAQFAPAAGQPGSTAIAASSPDILYWADSVSIVRGLMDIANPELGMASYGEPANAIGMADNNVVSLGDSGMATFFFDPPLVDHDGFEIAVFENSFADDYLELAFVEISSDGLNFFRFEAVSNTSSFEQIGPYGTLNTEGIHNLAGKYRGGFGTPFDFQELEGIAGLDIQNIIAVRLVDVIGTIDPLFGSFDSQGSVINDPYPTDFESGGFDLDALAVVDFQLDIAKFDHQAVSLYPQPCRDQLNVKFNSILQDDTIIEVFQINGTEVNVNYTKFSDQISINTTHLSKGFYLLKVVHSEQQFQSRFIVE